MNELFQPGRIGTLSISNRLVRSATYDGMAEKSGKVSPLQMDLYQKLARGGVGLIVTGIVSVHPSGRISAFQNTIDTDETIPGFKELTDAVHEHGARIAMQLFHGGRECVAYQQAKNRIPLAPSVVKNDPHYNGTCREMTGAEIEEIIDAFGRAASRAQAAGFDAVQVHAAHAYLFSQFLSPSVNLRTDSWGGSPANRLAFLQEVCKRIRSEVGADFPVMVKLGVADGFPGGLEFAEGKQAALHSATWGIDALEISQGLRGKRYSETEFRTGIRDKSREAYFRDWCREVHASVDIPVMMVGGLRSPDLMAEILRQDEADFVSISRPLIREPDIVHRWKQGDTTPSTCISCNRCFDNLLRGIPLACTEPA